MIINLIQLAGIVEKFYLSGKQYGTSQFYLQSPVNESYNLNLVHMSSFEATLSNTITNISLYLSSLLQVKFNTITTVANNCNQIEFILKKHKQHDYHKYLIENNLNGFIS